jgi:hypothetical protein
MSEATIQSDNTDSLDAMTLPELQARFAATTGETTRCPNKVFLVRRIREAEAQAAAAATAQAAVTTAPEEEEEATTPKPLTKMTVDELRAAYVDEVGRTTGSTDRGYLIWKIREARKGRIRVGPRLGPTPSELDGAHMVLPLRLPATVVEAIDGAWKALGLDSRMDLMRRAMRHYLDAEGQAKAAALLGRLVGDDTASASAAGGGTDA